MVDADDAAYDEVDARLGQFFGAKTLRSKRWIQAWACLQQMIQLDFWLIKPTSKINHLQRQASRTGSMNHLQVVAPPELLSPICIHPC